MKMNDGEIYFGIALLYEIKFYGSIVDNEIFLDIKKLMIDQNDSHRITIILLHECGGITKISITKESIEAYEPTKWKKVEFVEHGYHCDFECSPP